MKKSLSVGLMVGILSGLAGIVTAYVIGFSTGLWFDQLTWLSIGLASIVTNFVGALIFVKWLKKTERPRLYYTFLVAIITLVMTLNDIANPPEVDFGIVAHPLHIVVALISIWLVPKWLKQEKIESVQTTIDKNTSDVHH
ncbi:hypothetical protein [Alkalihalobacillus sp. AL-G]|uniref:hypothetical protein n=1 Tax=Alkalihalobacillus sp. AL-G TaxID=2926399 RepID=UPI00272A5C73|nr:hypothetical protein [Alkalihalobacillus sp. AL-G]WLD92605.1 hypothetical protein MOJ78_16540 [Alkalihalobacillus sp. AL-G]